MTGVGDSPGRDPLATASGVVLLAFAWSLPTSLFGMQLAAGLGAVLVLVRAVRSHGASLRASPLDRPILLLLVAIGLSLLLSPRPPTAFRTATSFWVLAAFYASYLLLADRRILGRALTGLIVLACAVAGFGIAQSLTGAYPLSASLHPGFGPLPPEAPGQPGWYAACGLFHSRLTFAHVLIFPVCWTLGLALERLKAWLRVGLLLAGGLLLVGLALTFTRAALVVAVAVGAVLAVSRLRAGWPRWAGLSALGLGALVAVVFVPAVSTRLGNSFAGKKDWGRLAIWQAALDLAAERPLTGIGYGNFQRDAVPHVERRTRQMGGKAFKGTYAWAHSNPLTFLAETGGLGLLALGWIFLAYFLAARRVLLRVREDPLLRGFVRGSMAAVAGFVLVGLFHDTFFDGEVIFCLWFTMGACLAVDRLAPARAGEGASR